MVSLMALVLYLDDLIWNGVAHLSYYRFKCRSYILLILLFSLYPFIVKSSFPDRQWSNCNMFRCVLRFFSKRAVFQCNKCSRDAFSELNGFHIFLYKNREIKCNGMLQIPTVSWFMGNFE